MVPFTITALQNACTKFSTSKKNHIELIHRESWEEQQQEIKVKRHLTALYFWFASWYLVANFMRSHSTAYEPNPHKTVRILIIIFVLFDLAVLSTQKSFLVDVFGLFFSRHTQSHTHCFMPFTAEKIELYANKVLFVTKFLGNVIPSIRAYYTVENVKNDVETFVCKCWFRIVRLLCFFLYILSVVTSQTHFPDKITTIQKFCINFSTLFINPMKLYWILFIVWIFFAIFFDENNFDISHI